MPAAFVVRSGHSLARRFDEAGALTLEECLAHRYVEVRPGPEWVLRAMDASVSEAWIARPRAVRTPYFFSAVQMVRRSDLCLTCSETLAREVAGTDEFRILPLPEEVFEEMGSEARLARARTSGSRHAVAEGRDHLARARAGFGSVRKELQMEMKGRFREEPTPFRTSACRAVGGAWVRPGGRACMRRRSPHA